MRRGLLLISITLPVLCCSCTLLARKAPELKEPPQPKPAETLESARSALKANSGKVDKVDAVDVVDSGRGEPPPGFGKDGLVIAIEADPGLNRFRNSAHALYLCFYQLKDPNAFNQFAEDKEGVAKLLECGRFDASVANAKRIVVQPGQRLQETRDRAEGARYIGIATGYFGNGKEKNSHLAPLSLKAAETVRIELGPYQIEKVTVK